MESAKGGDWMRTSENKEEFREQYRLLGLRTQEQLADEVGCSWSFLSQLESNNSDRIHAPSLYMLFKIAQVLDVPATKHF